MSSPGCRLRLNPAAYIHLIENHDEAYHIWRRAGVRETVLVHIDAHDDLWWTPDQASLNIANFISRALDEGLVREVFWVVPDQTWESSGGLKALRRRLVNLLKSYPGNSLRLDLYPQQISATILGKPLRVCTLAHLPRIEEQVLLDIDVDYLIIRQACRSADGPEDLPWRWPEDLVARLRAHRLEAALITIAYSVEGGYTPLTWKYLGDELALRLGLSGDGSRLRGLELMRVAALAAHRGELARGEEGYREAQELQPDSAAPAYHLAQLYLDLGRKEQAAASYCQALSLDPSYRTPYNNSGPWHYSAGHFREAEAAYRRILSLDPEDAYAHLGLGRVAARRQRWPEAEDWLTKALAFDPNLVDAYRTLGRVNARLGRLEAAIAAYERSLILALRGHRPLTDWIATEYQGLADPEHFLIHGRLARLYDRQGEVAKAISGYRLSIAKGGDGVFPRRRLACLYLKQRHWLLSAVEAWQAVKMIPQDLGLLLRRLCASAVKFSRGDAENAEDDIKKLKIRNSRLP